MKIYIKLITIILAFVFMLSGVSLLGVSAEDSVYTQPEKFIYGDIDLDGNVTVKDATLIRKGLAKITYVTAVQKCLADPDGIGYSVKNATAIQKYLANYETTTPWGEELIMASQDEFSDDISLIDMYHGQQVFVHPKSSMEFAHEYTLEDFPEDNFSKIEKKTYLGGKYVSYELYLAEPSKENLLDALKALDYRANLDLLSVDADFYDLSA